MAGLRDEQGNFLSPRTAEYPAQLATRFSNTVCHLFCPGPNEYPAAEPCFCSASNTKEAQIYPSCCSLGQRWYLFTPGLLEKNIPARLSKTRSGFGKLPPP